MRKSPFIMLSLAILAALTVLPAGAQIKKIVVGTDATYPPFENIVDGKFVGFDIDLAQAIAKEIGAEIEFVNVAWDGIIPGLLAKKYDMIQSAMTITEERAKQVTFSRPYYNAGQIVAVRVENTTIKDEKDLPGKRVGVQLGTTGEFAVKEIKGAIVKSYDTIDLAFIDLINGNVDAVVADDPTVAAFVKERGKGKLKIVGKPFTDEHYGIAMRKEDTALHKAVNAALEKLEKDGTIERLKEKWIK
ncbi:MAG: basic amino acid ABC transporter substrate-binding protein [bacterium]